MKRKTQLKRTGFKPGKSIGLSRKNARLRKVSSKKRKEIRLMGLIRSMFTEEVGVCCLCRKPSEFMQTHEMFGGGLRATTVSMREFWLAVCPCCHDELQGMPKAQQLSIKRRTDRAYFNLELVNKTIGNGKGNRFTEADIDQAEREVVL